MTVLFQHFNAQESLPHLHLSAMLWQAKNKSLFYCMNIAQQGKETLLREVIGFDFLQVLW